MLAIVRDRLAEGKLESHVESTRKAKTEHILFDESVKPSWGTPLGSPQRTTATAAAASLSHKSSRWAAGSVHWPRAKHRAGSKLCPSVLANVYWAGRLQACRPTCSVSVTVSWNLQARLPSTASNFARANLRPGPRKHHGDKEAVLILFRPFGKPQKRGGLSIKHRSSTPLLRSAPRSASRPAGPELMQSAQHCWQEGRPPQLRHKTSSAVLPI